MLDVGGVGTVPGRYLDRCVTVEPCVPAAVPWSTVTRRSIRYLVVCEQRNYC